MKIIILKIYLKSTKKPFIIELEDSKSSTEKLEQFNTDLQSKMIASIGPLQIATNEYAYSVLTYKYIRTHTRIRT